MDLLRAVCVWSLPLQSSKVVKHMESSLSGTAMTVAAALSVAGSPVSVELSADEANSKSSIPLGPCHSPDRHDHRFRKWRRLEWQGV